MIFGGTYVKPFEPGRWKATPTLRDHRKWRFPTDGGLSVKTVIIEALQSGWLRSGMVETIEVKLYEAELHCIHILFVVIILVAMYPNICKLLIKRRLKSSN